jgi:hypothetical protein
LKSPTPQDGVCACDAEILRAIADSLDCPLLPFVPA